MVNQGSMYGFMRFQKYKQKRQTNALKAKIPRTVRGIFYQLVEAAGFDAVSIAGCFYGAVFN